MKYAIGFVATVIMTALAPWQAQADVRLPHYFADNMMIQRDQPVSVCGWAAPGEVVKVTLAGKEASATADANGRWALKLAALKEGENLTLMVAGKNTITFKNVLVGDIWLCSGQSNMEATMHNYATIDDIKKADFPHIRLIKIKHTQSAYLEEDVVADPVWQVCTPQTVPGITAVGFYFAREVHQKTGVPIGIVDASWGGTPIEPWTSAESMETVPELKKAVTDRQQAIATYTTNLPKAMEAMDRWIATTKIALAKGTPLTVAPVIPVHPSVDWTGAWCGMYNAMIHPLTQYPIKGVLWYQGESNHEGDPYYYKMCALIGGWRKQWGLGDFPFYYVQLAKFGYGPNDTDPAGGDGWARIFCAQARALRIPHTGMAVIMDTDSNLHPVNKYDVGLRLSRWALVNEYGQKMEVSGPLFREMKVEGSKIRLFFDHVGAGLMVGKKTGREPTVEVKDGKLKRFAIAGTDKKWFWAEAVMDGANVVVSSPDVKEPVAVRYAFTQNPEGANLYNKDGLPASPFRTDDW